MYYIPMCALSQNQAWAGRRYKTSAYKEYSEAIKIFLNTFHLPKIPPKEKYYFIFEFGVTVRQDLSNCLKLLEDLISDHIGTDDRYVGAIFCTKVVVPKKKDCYIKFNIFLSEHELIQAINTEL